MSNPSFVGRLAAGVLAISAIATLAVAHQYALGALRIIHPWSSPTPPGAPTAVGYLSIINTGATPDRLLGGSTPAAAKLELHEMSSVGGVMRMRPLPGGLVLPPGGTVTLSPGGDHFMFIGLKRPFALGDRIPATLNFEHGGSVRVEFHVDPPAYHPSPMPGMAMPGGKGM